MLPKVLVAIPLGAYALYLAAVPAVLSAPVFSRLTGMTDENSTHIRFSRAWSLVPGRVRVGQIRILVREPDVELDIVLDDARARIDLGALREKKVLLRSLDVAETTVAIRKKDPPPDDERVGDVRAHVLARLAEERERLANRFTVVVERVELRSLPWVRLEEKTLRGRMAISGAFLFQAGTQAEVYPSRFTIEDGDWDDGEIVGIRLASEVRIHRFMKARVNGSEVFRYFHAALEATGKTKELRFLNASLRSLGDYGFGAGETSLEASLLVRGGRIQPGSRIRTDRNPIQLAGPRFDLRGRGRVEWVVGPEFDVSHLRAEVGDAKAKIHFGENAIAGTVRAVEARADIRGLDLSRPFTGLAARLAVRDGRFAGAPAGRPDPTKPSYRFRARIGGELAAVAGDDGDETPLPKSSDFDVVLEESELAIPDLGSLDGTGRISLAVRPIDFRAGRVDLPRFRIAYRGRIDGEYPLDLEWNSTRASRVFGLRDSANDRWEGSGRLKIEDFNGILGFLKATDRISGLVRAGLHATEVEGAIDWSVTPRETRIAVWDLDSNGIWSGSGVLVSERAPGEDGAETRGNFRGKVLGLPVGVGVLGSDVKVKLLSGGKAPEETRRP